MYLLRFLDVLVHVFPKKETNNARIKNNFSGDHACFRNDLENCLRLCILRAELKKSCHYFRKAL